MKLIKILVLVLVASAISLQSCKTVKNTPSANLAGKWVLKTLNGQNVDELFKAKTPTLEFNLNDKQISGTSGCNTYGGEYTLDKNKFSASKLRSTMMMCLDGENESVFTKALAETSDLSINKSGELVFSQNGKNTLVFEKAKPLSASDLTGTWKLQSITGATSNVYFGEAVPSITFNFETKKVNGRAGCNTYNSTFELTEKTITVNRPMTTRMACQYMEGENKFIESITGTSDITLENGTLTLRRDGKHLLSFVKSK